MVRDTLTADEIAERLADLLVERPEITLVVLFGSAGKNPLRRHGDVDIGVGCQGPANLDALYAAIARRLHADPIDIVDLARVGSLLAFEIARSGQLLFERRPGAFREFQSLASHHGWTRQPLQWRVAPMPGEASATPDLRGSDARVATSAVPGDPSRRNVYWSSSSFAPVGENAWFLWFDSGQVDAFGKGNANRVRAGRGGV